MTEENKLRLKSRGGGGTPIMAYTGRLQVYKRVGKSVI